MSGLQKLMRFLEYAGAFVTGFTAAIWIIVNTYPFVQLPLNVGANKMLGISFLLWATAFIGLRAGLPAEEVYVLNERIRHKEKKCFYIGLLAALLILFAAYIFGWLKS